MLLADMAAEDVGLGRGSDGGGIGDELRVAVLDLGGRCDDGRQFQAGRGVEVGCESRAGLSGFEAFGMVHGRLLARGRPLQAHVGSNSMILRSFAKVSLF
jgi:hypothetical protein